MIRRSIFAGILVGLLLSLAGLYPVLGLFAPLVLPDWQRPISTELLHSLALMLSTALGLPAIFGVGVLAAYRSNATNWKMGAKAGALAGGVAGLLVFFTLVSPLNALIGFSKVVPYLSVSADLTRIPIPALVDYLDSFEKGSWLLEVQMAVSILLGGLQGAWYGHRRRHEVIPERPNLYTLVTQSRNPREWFADDECATRTGLWVGLVMSFLTLLITLGWFYVDLNESLPPGFGEALSQSDIGVISAPLVPLLQILSPIIALALFGFGAVIVLLIKNPPDRFLSRIKAVVLAAVIISVSATAALLRILYFNVGLLPFDMLQNFHNDSLPGDQMLWVHNIFSPGAISVVTVVTVILLPWVLMFIAVTVGSLLGFLQGVLYSFTIPLVQRRSVDKADDFYDKFHKQPQELLPQFYTYYKQEPEMGDVLVHLVRLMYKNEPPASQLLAAYHTLGDSPKVEDHIEMVGVIHTILNENKTWRWAADLSAAYHALGQVLTARTVEQMAKIPPIAEQQTTSLPPAIVKSIQSIGRIIMEVQKVEKVEDLSTKLIFLENTLAAIHDAQRFIDVEVRAGVNGRPSLPEHAALTSVMDHWQWVVLTAVKRLKGRADIVCDLKTKQFPMTAQLPLVCQVMNKGLNVAQQVRLKLLPGEDYTPGDQNETWIEILPPGESRQLTFPILPDTDAQRLRVAWEISYDDAVDANRHFSFGDVVEFVKPDKPFQRIFPIPYVTGTPLKTDDVFVGREDVFAFIKENLLGKHQNNVIILHGQRRTGKTSVLYRLGEVMADTHYAVLIDMQGKPARGEADFLYAMADDIVYNLEEHGIEAELPPRKEFEESPEFFFRSRFLRGLYPHLNGKNLLLLFDEFEELQRRVEDGRLKPEIFQFLRNLMQHEDKVDFVFSGTHKLEELGAEYWSILFNIAVYKPITFLSPAEMQRLMRQPIAGYNMEYDPLAAERITAVTVGHPYFTQLVLHETVVYHNETQRNYLTVADIDQVLERIVERGEAHFKFIWAESTLEEKEVLQGLAELLVGKETIHVDELRGFLSECGCKSPDSWDHALVSLENRDILTRSSLKSPLYRFKVDLIRLWVERTRPTL